jgi:hypothetical protein
MIRNRSSIAAPLAIACLAGAADAQSRSRAEDTPRPAAAILRDYDSVRYPSMSDGADPESIARFHAAIEGAAARQEALALELFESAPEHARAPELLRARWTLLCNVSRKGAEVFEETGPFVADGAPPELREAAIAERARAALASDLPFEGRRRHVEAALAADPGNESAVCCAAELAKYWTSDPVAQQELAGRVRELAPDSETARYDLPALERMLASIGEVKTIDFAALESSLPMPDLAGGPFVVCFAVVPGSLIEESEAAAARRLSERFAARGLRIVTIHELMSDETPAARFERCRELGLEGPHLVDPARFDGTVLATAFRVNETPLAVLFDRAGRIVAFSFRLGMLEPAIEKLLGRRRAI